MALDIDETKPLPQDQAPPALEQALAREVLRSEHLRLTILVVFAGVALGVLIGGRFLARELGDGRLPVAFGAPFQLGLLSLAIGYLLLARKVVARRIRADRPPSAFVRYLTAFVETSLPTLATLALARRIEDTYALFYPGTSVYFLFIMLAILRLDFRLCVFTGAVAALEYAGLAWLFVGNSTGQGIDRELLSPVLHASRSFIFLATGVIAGLVSVQLRRQLVNSFRTLEERNRVIDMFGQHVSPAVVDRLLEQDVELGGEVRHVCLMFLDIRGFTSFSAGRPPQEVVEYLNRLFEFMVESVNRHNGIVNKFLGDGFMAVFGAPLSDGRDSQNAVAAAREIVARVAEANAAGEIPPTGIGIGLHAGQAVTGNVGSSRRKEYTIIGDTVNLASRIEQLNKEYGSQLLISEAVYRALDGETADAAPVGPVSIRGLEEPVAVYRLA